MHFRTTVRRYLRQLSFGDTLYAVYDQIQFLGALIRERTPLRNEARNLSCTPFFIVGSGRSGNTLLRAILCAHDELAIPPESYVLGPLIRQYRTRSFLPWPVLVRWILAEFADYPEFYTWHVDLAEIVGPLIELPPAERGLDRAVDRIYCRYIEEQDPSATRWGDKTPYNTLHLPWIDTVFPDAQYIHIVRDGRDVVNSYLDAGLYDRIEDACDRWESSVNTARAFGRRSRGRYLEVRYEDLVRQPLEWARRAADFLEVEFDEAMLEFWKDADALGDTHHSHHQSLYNPINQDSIGKWRKGLTRSQQETVQRRLASDLERFGYRSG